MPWAAAGAVVSAGIGAYSANKAAKGGQAATDQAIGLQQSNQQENVNRNAPWLQAGNEALATQRNLAGEFGHMPTAAEVMATPGYEFQRQQGVDAVQQGAAATSGNLSGAAQKALARYGTNFATTKYNDTFQQMRQSQNDIWGRYQQLSQGGQNAASLDAGIGTHSADAQGNLATNNASYQGAAGIAGANAIGTAIGQTDWNGVGRKVGGWFSNPNTAGGAAGAGWGSGAGYGNQDLGLNFADGGPVLSTRNRMRHYADGGPVTPIVGSRSPVRTGGGGALTRNAIIELLNARAMAQGTPAPGVGVGQLAANPLTDPQAILRARLQAAGEFSDGGPVHGPGGPREDAIPAKLSNGEHVMDAATVNAIGGGDNMRGQHKLNKLRAMLQAGGR